MNRGLFILLAEKTEKFTFSKVSGEPSDTSEERLRLFRLKELLAQVRKMGIRKYHQMPESFRISRTMDDWIQDAMIVLCGLLDEYDPQKGPFNNYARFIVSRRLTDIQRSLFRKNPPLDDDLRKVALSWKRENRTEPTAKELADLTGRDESEIRKFLEKGGGERVFVRENEETETADVRPCASPEQLYIREEARHILWECVEKLAPDLKMLFMHREFEGFSFQKLWEEPKNREILDSTSEKTFQRRYRERIYDRVQDCVQTMYSVCK